MKKAITKLASVVTLTVLNVATVFADGGNIYNPYETHDPIDTGLESGTFYLVAFVFFTLGLLTLSVVKSLKTKASLK